MSTLALEAFRGCPPQPTNHILAAMIGCLRLEHPRFSCRSACQQQGLLHLYQRYCQRTPCWGCVLA